MSQADMNRLHVLSAKLMTVLAVLSTATHVGANRQDHGGVAMGHINVCDDAKTRIAIDWDPNSSEEYTCDGDMISQEEEEKSDITCEDQTQPPIHVCYPTEIHYTEDIPTSGRHRPNWADYGEYLYVPPQRWLHDLEHGAVVMLYHPCADPDEVDRLRQIVTGCIRKHVITPYKLLPRDTPFALVTWGCKLTMSRVDTVKAQDFIQDHGKRDGPEGDYAKSGLYNQSLIVPARIVSDFDDSVLCPLSLMQKGRPGESQGQFGDEDVLEYLDSMPDFLPSWLLQSNPVVFQSLRRRQRLNRETERMQSSVRGLERAFEQLVGQ